MTHDELIPLYEKLQKKGYGTSSVDRERAKKIFDWIKSKKQRGSVFDASCGRGYLLSMLKDAGYVVYGSEASGWMVENLRGRIKCPIYHLRYSELSCVKIKSFDCVVSNDVLEHLLTENEVKNAIMDLCSLSSGLIAISVGLNKAIRDVCGKRIQLHPVVKSHAWWLGAISESVIIENHFRWKNSYFIFGEVKNAT